MSHGCRWVNITILLLVSFLCHSFPLCPDVSHGHVLCNVYLLALALLPTIFHDVTGVDFVLTNMSTMFSCTDLAACLISPAVETPPWASLMELPVRYSSFIGLVLRLFKAALPGNLVNLPWVPDSTYYFMKIHLPTHIWFPGPSASGSPESEFISHKFGA